MIGNFTRSRGIEISAIADTLRAAEPGTTITYDEMSAALGSDCRQMRHVVSAARQQVCEEGFVFEAISNVGYRRMTEQEVASVVPIRRTKRIRGQARRGLRELSSVQDIEALGPAERARYYAGAALMGAIAAVASARGLKKIGEFAVQSASLPLDQTLDALKGIR